MTARRRELLDRLLLVQHNQHVDIMTITGFMSDDEVAKHLARYETAELERAYAKPSPKSPRRAA